MSPTVSSQVLLDAHLRPANVDRRRPRPGAPRTVRRPPGPRTTPPCRRDARRAARPPPRTTPGPPPPRTPDRRAPRRPSRDAASSVRPRQTDGDVRIGVLGVDPAAGEHVRATDEVGVQVALQHADLDAVVAVAQQHHRRGVTDRDRLGVRVLHVHDGGHRRRLPVERLIGVPRRRSAPERVARRVHDVAVDDVRRAVRPRGSPTRARRPPPNHRCRCTSPMVRVRVRTRPSASTTVSTTIPLMRPERAQAGGPATPSTPAAADAPARAPAGAAAAPRRRR